MASMIEKPGIRVVPRRKFFFEITEELKEQSRETDSIFVPIMVEEPWPPGSSDAEEEEDKESGDDDAGQEKAAG